MGPLYVSNFQNIGNVFIQPIKNLQTCDMSTYMDVMYSNHIWKLEYIL